MKYNYLYYFLKKKTRKVPVMFSPCLNSNAYVKIYTIDGNIYEGKILRIEWSYWYKEYQILLKLNSKEITLRYSEIKEFYNKEYTNQISNNLYCLFDRDCEVKYIKDGAFFTTIGKITNIIYENGNQYINFHEQYKAYKLINLKNVINIKIMENFSETLKFLQGTKLSISLKNKETYVGYLSDIKNIENNDTCEVVINFRNNDGKALGIKLIEIENISIV